MTLETRQNALPEATGPSRQGQRPRKKPRHSLIAQGEPLIWLTGGALSVALAMILLLLATVFWHGLRTLWPAPIAQVRLLTGAVYLGEFTRSEEYKPADHVFAALPADIAKQAKARVEENGGIAHRRLLRTENFEITNTHFHWIDDFLVEEESFPADAVLIERETNGRFYGFPVAYLENGKSVATSAAEIWKLYRERSSSSGDASSGDKPADQVVLKTIGGQEAKLPLDQIVRVVAPNELSWGQKFGVYVSRWWEFLSQDPREANSEGGIFPCIFGTVVMTLGMTLMVVPFGVLAALYLREYAKAGLIVSAVRIAINNLAGVPSIVFGVFGLGFFCYVLGHGIDVAFGLKIPTYGTGGLLWASLTLALLTLPVIIVATEEALAAVPGSMREGSYACGASKWQTIRRIVLPRALPGIMTGMILAMARGAGEVAPLMLVGAVKIAKDLPLDFSPPFIHPERSFMHLGFHIFDVAFQSQNSEAGRPMVYSTTLLLICIIAFLNLAAVWIRARLRQRFTGGHF